jgi:crotonobetainyl-CoA:carnitine CoA-transferase CaiB-like acyl-CoA transferase
MRVASPVHVDDREPTGGRTGAAFVVHPSEHQHPDGPLQGLRVVDLTRMLAGPYCTMLLGDLGADVVKVEPPGGDLTRGQGPFRPDDEERRIGGYFQSVNRNKRSVELDLAQPDGRDRLRRLIRGADVLVENFRPGVMERWGLSYETLAEEEPQLVYAAIRGFGDPRSGESPLASWPAYDVVAQAMGGLIGITGLPGAPVKVGPGIGDIFPAVLCAVGILAALHERSSSGLGQFVDVGMYDSVLALCERIVHQYSYAGDVPGPEGNTHPLLCPFDVFPCVDGFVAIAAPSDSHWRTLSERIGRPDLGRTHARHSDRLADAAVIRDAILEWTTGRTKAVIVEALGGDVPVGPVNTVEDIFKDPHVHARSLLVEVDEPGCHEPVTIVGTPIKLSRTPGGVRRRAPLLDEHAQELFGDG